MKTSTTFMALASILSMAFAAPSPAAAAADKPEGYIDMFKDIDCAEAKGAEGTQAGLTQGNCMNSANAFSSFRAGTQGSLKCPTKTKPHVNVYQNVDCGGNVIETPALAADGETSTCQNVVFGLLKVTAKSAQFVCI